MRSRHRSRQSKTFIARRRARLTSCVIGIAGMLCISILVVWGVVSTNLFTITNVQIAGVENQEVQILHDKVTEILSGSYIGVFPRNNSLIYPRSEIRSVIWNIYREVESIDLRRAGFHTLIVTVHEKIPSAVVCATLPDFNNNELSLDDSDACYFADSSGILFKKAPSFSGDVYNRYYVPDLESSDGSTDSLTKLVGTRATSTEEFSVIQQVYETIQRNNITIDAMLMKNDREYEIYIRNPDMSSSTAIVYFNTISPAMEQISNLILFWNHILSAARAKKEYMKFDYIDVRYSPNIYHRFARKETHIVYCIHEAILCGGFRRYIRNSR